MNLPSENEIERLTSILSTYREALEELRELFDGKEDIDENDGANDAMRAIYIIDATLSDGESGTSTSERKQPATVEQPMNKVDGGE